MGEGKMVPVKDRLYDFNVDGIAVLAKKPGDLVSPEELKHLEKTTKAFRDGKEPFAKLQAAAAGQVQRTQVARDDGKSTTPLVDPDAAKKAAAADAKDADDKAAAEKAKAVQATAAQVPGPEAPGKPVHNMSIPELKELASERGVDISACENRGDMIKVLRPAK